MHEQPHDLGRWFEAYSRPLGLYARQWLDAEAAADVVQESFLKLMRQRRRPDDVRAWLFRVVRNAAISELRTRRRRSRHAPAIAAGQAGWFESRPERGLDAAEAQQALARLSEKQRETVLLRLWGQMTLEQIARVVGCSVSTAHRRYAAAIHTLRTRMNGHERPRKHA